MNTINETVPTGVKIQINSAEALNRLVGNSPELELELKNAVVKTFADRHLPMAFRNEISAQLNLATSAFNKEIKEQIEKQVGRTETGGWHPKFTLSSDVRGAIRTQVESELRSLLYTEVQEIKTGIQKMVADYFTDLKKEIGRQIAATTDKIINQEVEVRLQARLDNIKKNL